MGEAVEGEDGAVDEETGIPEATEDGTALDGTAQDLSLIHIFDA